MRFYVASITVMTDIQNDTEVSDYFSDSILPKQLPVGTLSNNMPAFIPAESMEDAAEAARVMAFERWKPEDGWRSHQVNIMPMPETGLDALTDAYDANALEVEERPGLTFDFIPGKREPV